MTDWFYEEAGTPRGPINEEDLGIMLSNRLLPPTTRIWTASFGQEWKPAHQTSLAAQIGALPPPLPAGAIQAVPPLPHQPGTTGKPAESTTIYALLLACSPLAVLFADVVGRLSGVDPNSLSYNNWVSILLTLIAVILAFADVKILNSWGFNPRQRRIVPFLLLSPIGYFWRRAAVVGRDWNYLWIWLGCVALAVAGQLTMLADR
jgi:hypothetical protein